MKKKLSALQTDLREMEKKVLQLENSKAQVTESDYKELVKRVDTLTRQYAYTQRHANEIAESKIRMEKSVKQQQKDKQEILKTVQDINIKQTTKLACIKLRGGTCGGNGQLWQWATIDEKDDDYYRVLTVSYNNDTVEVKKAGHYLVLLRVHSYTAANYYAELRINSNSVSRCYMSSCGQTYKAHEICEVFSINAGSNLNIYQNTAHTVLNSDPHNQWSIVYLGY